MKRIFRPAPLTALLALALIVTASAQRRRFSGGYRSQYTEGGVLVQDTARTAREVDSHSTGTPNWTNQTGFARDSFSFCRIRYSDNPNGASGGTWLTDFPDSDLNLSFRVQQMTSMAVNPNGRIMRLKEKELFDYPWIYMVEPGRLLIEDDEAPILKSYLLNGGFLMADDFWGERQWGNFEEQIKKVFPDRSFVDLPMDHPVFHSVFNLEGPLEKLQTPNYRTGAYAERTGVTWENHDGEECREMHVRAILDDKGRIMVIATHNTDNGDGWEREGEYQYYFREFSEKRAFPLGVNIIFYVMTH